MYQGCHRTGRKPYILEPEPNVEQHTYGSYDNCHYRIASHLIADRRGNTLCRNQAFIYIEALFERLIQRLPFIQSQFPRLDNNLVRSGNLLCLNIRISCHSLDNRFYLGINIRNAHILIKGHIC